MKMQKLVSGLYKSLTNQIWKFCFVLALVLMVTAVAQAQGDVEGGDNPDEGVPIDGGISLLVAAGIGYGVKKVHEARKKKEQAGIGQKN